MQDRFSAIFSEFLPQARVFLSGNSCQQAAFDGSENVGHIHIIKSGSMLLSHAGGQQLRIIEPSVLFYPRPHAHNFESCANNDLELLCASIDLGGDAYNPLYDSLPDFVLIPLSKLDGLEPLLEVMFIEAFQNHCGRQVALDNLVGYFFVLLLRHLIEVQDFQIGVLAGLSDPKLSKAITAVHNSPSNHWNLERLAEVAGMSRARFAAHFRESVGLTPMDYVTQWRMGLVQSLIKKGHSLKMIAPMVGYQSAAAMTRTFTNRIGVSPSEWLAAGKQGDLAEAATEPKNLETFNS